MRGKMMPLTKVVIAAGFLAGWAANSVAVHAADPTRVRRTLQNDYDRMNVAVSKKDLNTLFSYFAPDYVSVDATGNKLNKPQNRHILEQLCCHVKQITITSKIKRVVKERSRAQVTVESTMTMIVINPRTQQMIKGVGTTEYLDEWVEQKNHQWLLRTNNVLASRKTISSAL